jgi:hypothetical protein
LFFLSYLVMVLRTTPSRIHHWDTIQIWVFAVPAIVVALEAVFYPEAYAFQWLAGIAVGITLALFVGRLESKFIDCPQWLLAALYLYSLIQVSYAGMQNGDPLTDSQAAAKFLGLTSLALILKILMFQYIGRIIGSGVLTYYMLKSRALFDEEPNDRDTTLRSLLV